MYKTCPKFATKNYWNEVPAVETALFPSKAPVLTCKEHIKTFANGTKLIITYVNLGKRNKT